MQRYQCQSAGRIGEGTFPWVGVFPSIIKESGCKLTLEVSCYALSLSGLFKLCLLNEIRGHSPHI